MGASVMVNMVTLFLVIFIAGLWWLGRLWVQLALQCWHLALRLLCLIWQRQRLVCGVATVDIDDHAVTTIMIMATTAIDITSDHQVHG